MHLLLLPLRGGFLSAAAFRSPPQKKIKSKGQLKGTFCRRFVEMVEGEIHSPHFHLKISPSASLPCGALPAALRALFHLMPMFWPRLWHSVMAMAPTFPYWSGGGEIKHKQVGFAVSRLLLLLPSKGRTSVTLLT